MATICNVCRLLRRRRLSSRAHGHRGHSGQVANAIGIDHRQMPRDFEMSRLFEARRADTGEAWSQHKRKLSGFDLVFSPHKSISLAVEFAATPAGRPLKPTY
jgi:hypothetical protein